MTGHQHHHDHSPAADDHEPGGRSAYPDWVAELRDGKDDYFRRAPDSPIPEGERASFSGLSYYPVDVGMRFEFLTLGPVPEGLETETQVQTSDGATRSGSRVGTLRFGIDDTEYELVGLRLVGAAEGFLFVPFKDATNGAETYAAGRYLDLMAQDDGTYDLDFNLAYAPFCAYSPSYSCPLPPRENWLTVRIEAGERNG